MGQTLCNRIKNGGSPSICYRQHEHIKRGRLHKFYIATKLFLEFV